MPRRSSNKSSSPVQRRQSARIAAASANKSPTPSPAKKTRRSTKRDSASKLDISAENVDHNGNESSPKQPPVVEEPPEKKSKTEKIEGAPEKESEVNQEQAPSEETVADDDETPKMEPDVAKEAGFEIVDKSKAPPAESEEVKKAIDAQGEDGQLLVNYFQVVKDEIPAILEPHASTSGDKPPSNGTETKGEDVPAETSVEKHSTGDPGSNKEEVTAEEASH